MNMIIIMSQPIEALFARLSGRICVFAAGEALFHAGDAVHHLHFINSGIVHLIRFQHNGSALILQRARKGSVLAEASIYSTCYHCDARAETEVKTWAVSRDEIRKQLVGNPDFSETWASYLAREIQRLRLHEEILSLRTVAARLDAWIGWNGPLPDKGQWLLIAREIGVSPEALYREIAARKK